MRPPASDSSRAVLLQQIAEYAALRSAGAFEDEPGYAYWLLNHPQFNRLREWCEGEERAGRVVPDEAEALVDRYLRRPGQFPLRHHTAAAPLAALPPSAPVDDATGATARRMAGWWPPTRRLGALLACIAAVAILLWYLLTPAGALGKRGSGSASERSANCEPAHPTLCLPRGGPDVNCTDLSERRFPVLHPDPYFLDYDGDGIGCE